MQLVIAEKPSVARNIAKVLHATNVKDGYLEGKEYLVSWCIGHLIELASADQYLSLIHIYVSAKKNTGASISDRKRNSRDCSLENWRQMEV